MANLYNCGILQRIRYQAKNERILTNSVLSKPCIQNCYGISNFRNGGTSTVTCSVCTWAHVLLSSSMGWTPWRNASSRKESASTAAHGTTLRRSPMALVSNYACWRHQVEAFSASLALCEVTGGFPSQRPVTRDFDVLIYASINGRTSNRDVGDLMSLRSLWRHCYEYNYRKLMPTLLNLIHAEWATIY